MIGEFCALGRIKRAKQIRPFLAPPAVCKVLEQSGKAYRAKAGSLLFRRGEPSKGVFLVLSGRVALSAGEDPTRIVRVAEKGSLLGLPATVSGSSYSLTAEVVADSELSLISPSLFRNILSKNPAVGFAVVNLLAAEVSILRRLAVYKF